MFGSSNSGGNITNNKNQQQNDELNDIIDLLQANHDDNAVHCTCHAIPCDKSSSSLNGLGKNHFMNNNNFNNDDDNNNQHHTLQQGQIIRLITRQALQKIVDRSVDYNTIRSE
eukprot:UN10610